MQKRNVAPTIEQEQTEETETGIFESCVSSVAACSSHQFPSPNRHLFVAELKLCDVLPRAMLLP
jgi:hypothetical protein